MAVGKTFGQNDRQTHLNAGIQREGDMKMTPTRFEKTLILMTGEGGLQHQLPCKGKPNAKMHGMRSILSY